jgi:hypothetical protein
MSAEARGASARWPASTGRYLSWAIAVLSILAYLPALAGPDVYRAWTREDGPVESAGAIAFLAASLLFGAVYRISRRGPQEWWTRRFVAGHPGYLALCAVMLLVCMEEISWGQRLLDFKTPDAIARVNRQRETNIHNLEWFHGHDRSHQRKGSLELTHNMDRLFSAFNVALGILVPLACRRERWRRVVDRAGAPILALGVGLLFMGNYALSKILERFAPRHGIVEIKECNAALIWLALGILALLAALERWKTVPPVGPVETAPRPPASSQA